MLIGESWGRALLQAGLLRAWWAHLMGIPSAQPQTQPERQAVRAELSGFRLVSPGQTPQFLGLPGETRGDSSRLSCSVRRPRAARHHSAMHRTNPPVRGQSGGPPADSRAERPKSREQSPAAHPGHLEAGGPGICAEPGLRGEPHCASPRTAVLTTGEQSACLAPPAAPAPPAPPVGGRMLPAARTGLPPALLAARPADFCFILFSRKGRGGILGSTFKTQPSIRSDLGQDLCRPCGLLQTLRLSEAWSLAAPRERRHSRTPRQGRRVQGSGRGVARCHGA
ncbi:hypothetical protein HJG60_008519 [Phyllostomus discolor]|uniref:Translation initiation factor IF-2-like n=1 Tax=Phyllostomus discolor TaxID=89673 RepID=A0A833Z091_9CHIR|nr:hypothetical protein HJG60_008519 [Phyllostomus discolor]